MRYTVNTVPGLLDRNRGLSAGWSTLAWMNGLLPGKKITNTAITFGQKYYGEKLRLSISSARSLWSSNPPCASGTGPNGPQRGGPKHHHPALPRRYEAGAQRLSGGHQQRIAMP